MQLRISTSLLVYLLILNLLSSGKVEGFSNGVNHMYSADKDGVVIGNNRKVQVLDVALDYDYAGPNPKHDPRGKKPGGGGNKNP
ncbi:uncharacterized protein LOC113762795 [Coffea eugenioides]|uniref:Uncharacterized protein n=1 Tax=Coffea arabica TaxID=13443 RepID=A0A6P6W4Y6_COFAR|nr:uncharacterized protein LOC113729911 [Coffea arabica]XP_027162192.1 uncharacterized protein LOC113762795 [Coffea eugenioides]